MAVVRRGFVGVFTVALVVAIAIPSLSKDAIASSVVLNAELSSGVSCDIDCGEQYCDGGYHDAWETHPNFYFWTRNGGVHTGVDDCRAGTCDTMHGPWCNPMEEDRPDMDAIRKYSRDSDAQSIAAVVSRDPRVTFNSDRSAVQVIDCKGSVVMHLPVRFQVARRVASLLNAN